MRRYSSCLPIFQRYHIEDEAKLFNAIPVNKTRIGGFVFQGNKFNWKSGKI